MTRTKQDYINLLDETVNYYAEDSSRRATDDLDGCQYLTEEGSMCAVGRCINQDMMDYKQYNNGISVDTLIGKLTDNVFKEEYQGYDIKFWALLQNLHDDGCNWNENGLTEDSKYDILLTKKYIDEKFV